MARALRRNVRSRARGSNGNGGAVRTWSEGERARERARRHARSGGKNGENGESLAGPVGWRRPASEQPPLPLFFFNFFFQKLKCNF